MRRITALFLALIMLLSLAACGKKEPGISAADKLNKLPVQQEEPEKLEQPEQAPEKEKPAKEKPEKGSKEEPEANMLTIGTISLDLDGRNAYKNGELVDLTAREFDVIEFLMRNPNKVYSRDALLDSLWTYDYRSDIRTVDVHIRRLREKLEENPAQPKYIMTKWGKGYYFQK